MSSDKSREHAGPKESKFWHFRVNDTSAEQYEYLLNVECEYINIGALEKNKVREGEHYHVIVKFKRSFGLGSVKKLLLFNQKLNPADWYLATKYTRTKNLNNMVAYAIKNGSRFESCQISKRDGGEFKDESDSDDVGVQDMEIKDDDPEFKPCPDIWFTYKRINLSKCTKYQKNELRTYHARRLNYQWFELNDFSFSLTGAFKTLCANCQHKPDLKNLTRLCNWYIYGEPGTGKSSLIEFLFPKHFRKIKTNEKWDSYSNYLKEHEVVYFDELDSISDFDMCLGNFAEFKTITDVYPFPVRSNYGNQQIMVRPKRFVITSNFSFSMVVSSDDKHGRKVQHQEKLLSAFGRRFKVLTIDQAHELTGTHFDKAKKRTVYNDDVDYFCTETDTIIYKDIHKESDFVYTEQVDISEDDVFWDLQLENIRKDISGLALAS
jgi:hypothetical protein